MKLLLVAPYFYPKIGGMENYVYNIAKGLHKTYKWDVVVITSNHEEKKYKEEVISGLKIYRLPYWFKLSNTPINPLWYFQIKKIIKKEKPDIINAHSPVPFMADITKLVSGNRPFIITYHAGSMRKNKIAIDIIIRFYESTILKYLFYSSDRIVSQSKQFIDEKLVSYKCKVTVIPPGVDISIYTPPKKKKHSNTVLFVGRIEKSSEWKGIYYLLDAIKIVKQTIKDIKLEIVGSGDAVDVYKNYSIRNMISKNVIFLGRRSGLKLVQCYQNADVLVLPSTSDAESFGMVLIEAMATSLPVIGSKIGGIPNVIDNNVNGLLVNPNDANSLSDAIIELLSQPNKAKEFGLNGYLKVIQNYSWDKQIDKINNLLYETCK